MHEMIVPNSPAIPLLAVVSRRTARRLQTLSCTWKIQRLSGYLTQSRHMHLPLKLVVTVSHFVGVVVSALRFIVTFCNTLLCNNK